MSQDNRKCGTYIFIHKSCSCESSYLQLMKYIYICCIEIYSKTNDLYQLTWISILDIYICICGNLICWYIVATDQLQKNKFWKKKTQNKIWKKNSKQILKLIAKVNFLQRFWTVKWRLYIQPFQRKLFWVEKIKFSLDFNKKSTAYEVPYCINSLIIHRK